MPLVRRAANHGLLRDETAGDLSPFLAPPGDIPPARVSGQRTGSDACFVVEPHADDAALSVGGFLSQLSCDVVVVTVFGNSDSAHPGVAGLLRTLGLNPRDLRCEEAEAFARALDAKWINLGFADDAISKDGVDGVRAELLRRLRCEISQDDRVLLPAGFGGHPHHLLVRSCATEFPHHALYEDLAPIDRYARSTAQFWKGYHELMTTHCSMHVNIDSAIELKTDLASIYRSQYPPSQSLGLREYAESVGIARYYLGCSPEPGVYFERIFPERSGLQAWTELSRLMDAARTRPTVEFGPSGVPCPSNAEREGRSPDRQPVHIPEDHAVTTDRESRRDLVARRLGGESLMRVLWRTFGRRDQRRFSNSTYEHFAYPTAGGLGSTKALLLAWNVSGFDAGVYEYRPSSGELDRVYMQPPRRLDLWSSLGGQDWVFGASAAILIAEDATAAQAKYGDLASRLLLLEAGHAAQLFQMEVCAAGWGCVEIPAFDKPLLARLASPRWPALLVLIGALPHTTPRYQSVSHPKWSRVTLPLSPEHREPQLADGTETEVGACLSPRILRASTRPGGLALARRAVPATDYVASGTSLAMDDSDAAWEQAAALAKVKAAAEAREIWVARTSRASEVVRCRITDLHDLVVPPSSILLDSSQISALESTVAHRSSGDSDRHWILGHDISSREPVWLPTDAVLLDRRFFDWDILPSSTGLGCSRSEDAAIRHGVLEVIERAVARSFVMDWRRTDVSSVSSRVDLLTQLLDEAGQEVSVRTAEVAGAFVCRATCNPSDATGSAACDRHGDAIAAALGECAAKVFASGNQRARRHTRRTRERGPNQTGRPPCPEQPPVCFRLAVVSLVATSELRDLLPGWPVVRVVAWK